jgi:hypothetical protein
MFSALRLRQREANERYQDAVATYRARLPLEEMRVKLLREAGLEASVQLGPPKKPFHSSVFSFAELKRYLAQGVVAAEKLAFANAAAATAAAQARALEAMAALAAQEAQGPQESGAGTVAAWDTEGDDGAGSGAASSRGGLLGGQRA